MAKAFEEAVPNGTVQGECAPEFAKVAREFVRNFAERQEVGASVALVYRGETVVDLWGGSSDREGTRPWQRETMTCCYSCTKGMVALCVHLLVSRGEIDIDDPVTEYWPEFGQGGKQDVTVRMVLDHSVGLPAIREPLKELGCTDWEYMVDRLSREEPFWKPGTRNGYQMINFGWTAGELVRRVTGRSLGTFFHDEIARPAGAEFWIGLPGEEDAKYSPSIPYVRAADEPFGDFELALLNDKSSIQWLALMNNGGFDPNSRECRAAEIGGGGGVGNGRGLALAYAPFAHGGEWQGRRFVDGDTLARMAQVSVATHEDATLLIPTRFALGFMKSIDNRRRYRGGQDSALLSEAAFGHVGAGGSIGFADPQAGFSFGYAMNRMDKGILLNERGQALVDAAYRSLGFATDVPGVWVR